MSAADAEDTVDLHQLAEDASVLLAASSTKFIGDTFMKAIQELTQNPEKKVAFSFPTNPEWRTRIHAMFKIAGASSWDGHLEACPASRD